jgi:hypothetical protein
MPQTRVISHNLPPLISLRFFALSSLRKKFTYVQWHYLGRISSPSWSINGEASDYLLSEKEYLTFGMKIVFLTLLFIVSVTATARARLGETADQLVARYGPPISEVDQKGEGTKIALANVVFQKGGFEIDVTVTDGISVLETFKKLNGNALTIGEVRTLLTANSQGHEWAAPRVVEGEKWWSRDDSATAKLAQDGSLTIRSRELVVKEAVAKKLERAPSLEGF